MCRSALRTPNSRSPAHYVPLHRARHPSVKNDNTVTHVYDPANLPLRTHADFLDTARVVQMAPTTAQSIFLQRIQASRHSILSYLPSLFFPFSFPMIHAPYLREHHEDFDSPLDWRIQGLDEGTGQYHLMPKVWEAIVLRPQRRDQHTLRIRSSAPKCLR